MRGGHALPPKLGMTLILKICRTSSDIFNQTILNYCADTDETITTYYLKDPCLMENDNAYAKYVPVGVCGYLQDKYLIFFKNGRWPTLTKNNITEVNK